MEESGGGKERGGLIMGGKGCGESFSEDRICETFFKRLKMSFTKILFTSFQERV